MADEAWMSEPVEVPPQKKRKRKKYRCYPKPICTPEEKKVLWEHQGRR
jgi:hypothetical protein